MALVLIPGFVMFGGLLSGRRQRVWLLVFLTLLTLMCVVAMQGCSKGDADVIQGSIPPGTYTITLTATAGQISHNVVFTLTMTK